MDNPSPAASSNMTVKTLFDVAPTLIPVIGEDSAFPVRRIYCIGRNYAAHAREMGGDPSREPPFFFQKPRDSIQVVRPGAVVDHPMPPLTKNYHHEVELVVALGSGGRDIAPADALGHVFGYAVGLDMTRRDLQNAMREAKRPWDVGKGFDNAAPVGPIQPVAQVGHPARGAISAAVNGTVRQNADLADMIWSVAEQIANLSQAFELKAGDLIFSGTPDNVGAVGRGDVLTAHVDGLPDLTIRIV
ncbi:fumarylacetoacetate hydrolase family protein [Blastochloris viridis]|nr:fumarylacetoacetate hydrolase family protein [Blastochloris viridis]